MRYSFRKAIFSLLVLASAVTTGSAYQAPESAQGVKPTKEPVPDWLAWRLFQQSLDFHAKQEAAKNPPVSDKPIAKKSLFQSKMNSFEWGMKKQFGLAPEHTAVLLNSGQSYLNALETINADAEAEVLRRYARPQPFVAKDKNSGKTLLERSKEDGLHAEIEEKRRDALDKHLQRLTNVLGAAEVRKLTEWVQTAVVPRIVLTSHLPAISNNGRPASLRDTPLVPRFGGQR